MGTFAEKVSYLNETKLLIKDAIKNKGVAVEEDTPFREYANKIASISASADDIEPIVLTGDCTNACSGAMASAYINLFGNTVSTSGITNSTKMFLSSKLTNIPFELNYGNSNSTIDYTFNNCNLESIPKMNNCSPYATRSLFQNCRYIREVPEDIDSWFNWSYIDSNNADRTYMFFECCSLRKMPPAGFFNHAFATAGYNESIYCYTFSVCYVLDEILDYPIPYSGTWTSNSFRTFLDNTERLKNFTFATLDGAPYVMNWKSQTMDLSYYVGYTSSTSHILNYNSGIAADKEVTDDATYQALKDDPDWFTTKVAYSRYNHDSAVATINSLPDTSAYLTANGGTNTIKFKGAAGELTDGGAINTLTEEEIAVATAKGWTVTLV